jgi:hypothetical protein
MLLIHQEHQTHLKKYKKYLYYQQHLLQIILKLSQKHTFKHLLISLNQINIQNIYYLIILFLSKILKFSLLFSNLFLHPLYLKILVYQPKSLNNLYHGLLYNISKLLVLYFNFIKYYF